MAGCVSYSSHIQRHPVNAGGRGSPPLRRGFGSCGQLCDPSRHKKTTHALHRRFAFLSGLSTADVIRLPNRAGFRIWDGSRMRSQNHKSSPASIQNSTLTRLIAFIDG